MIPRQLKIRHFIFGPMVVMHPSFGATSNKKLS